MQTLQLQLHTQRLILFGAVHLGADFQLHAQSVQAFIGGGSECLKVGGGGGLGDPLQPLKQYLLITGVLTE